MCARIDALSIARAYVTDYVNKNPKATEMDVQVAVREHLQNLRENGNRISSKVLSQVVPTVREVYTAEQARANFKPLTTPPVQRAKKKFNANAAVHHYEQLDQMGKGARKKWHQKNMADAKQAFASEEYLEVLKRNNPAEYEKEVARLQAEKDVVSNNAGKKEANVEYQSSKKKKTAKKTAEAASQAEHRRERLRTKGQKLYRTIANHEIIADAPWKSAEASARVFEEHGLTDIEKSFASKPVANASTSSSAGRSAAQTAESAANAAKKAGKGKWGWIAAGVGVLAAAVGGKSYMDNKKEQEQQLNLSA